MRVVADRLEGQDYSVCYVQFQGSTGRNPLSDILRNQSISVVICSTPLITGSRRNLAACCSSPWCDIWNALYWRFIDKHRDFFSRNPRLLVMTSYVERMGRKRLGRYVNEAERFLDGLGSSKPARDS
jgi:deoxyribodipyrimidine photolyase-like uncharacterized protein